MNTELSKHTIWDIVVGAETFESFKSNVLEPLFLNPQIPEDIVDVINIAEKLLLHSFYEYEFIDLALTQATVALEKAMRMRYVQINNKEANTNFKGLIDWFFQNNYFETNNETFIHTLRTVRNRRMHEVEKSLGGIVFIKPVYDAIGLINDLYESSSLRVKRKNDLKYLKDAMNGIFKEGGILYYNNQQLIIFNAYPVFINNKKEPEELYLSVCPIFDLAPYRNGETFSPYHIKVAVTDWSLGDNEFKAKIAGTENDLKITKIVDNINWGRFCNWHDELIELDKSGLILYRITESIDKYFRYSLKEFHKTVSV